MKLLKFGMLASAVMLSGCAFHGIMPTQYDGEPLERDGEAIDAYVNDGQMINVSAVRYPFIESNDLTGLAEVEGSDDDTEVIEAGEYTVPDDFEPGIYQLEIGGDVSSSAVVVYDSDDVRVLETSLLGRNGTSHVMLDDGYRLEFKTRFGTLHVTPIESEMVEAGEEGLVIPQGIYIVGEHIEAGDYSLKSEELLVMRNDGAPEVFWNSYGVTYEHVMERTMTDDYRPDELAESDLEVIVNLSEGDVVIVEKVLSILEN